MSTLLYGKSTQNWLYRYKLYHIPFWCMYHYLWWVVAMGNPLKAANSIFFSIYSIKFIFYVVFQALAVYFNLYVLIPRYLEKSKFSEYISYLIITLLGASLCIISGYYLLAFLSPLTLKELYGQDNNCFYYFFGMAFPSTCASMTLAMSIKLTKNWIETGRRQQILEKEKLETELKFLKYQFNPHFLFNSINSIFFLIHKNPDMASDSLAKFSELLRHQLYESNDQQISLSKEINYLENFIELEKLRQNKNVEVRVDIEIPLTNQLGIAPFILMTFVENAFKHVSKNTEKPNWISIHMKLVEESLYLVVANSASPDTVRDAVSYGGIGLKNVQRRLDLIYPEKYELDIKNEFDCFEVNLRLKLEELTLSPTMQMA